MNLLWIVDEMLDDQHMPEVRNTADIFLKAREGSLQDDSSIVRMTIEWVQNVISRKRYRSYQSTQGGRVVFVTKLERMLGGDL